MFLFFSYGPQIIFDLKFLISDLYSKIFNFKLKLLEVSTWLRPGTSRDN